MASHQGAETVPEPVPSRTFLPQAVSRNPITSSSFALGSGSRVSSSVSPPRAAWKLASPRALPQAAQHDSSIEGWMMEKERALRSMQLQNFERERETFKQERALWDSERERLNARIRDLENTLEELETTGFGPDGRRSSVPTTTRSQSSSPMTSKLPKKASSFSGDHRSARLYHPPSTTSRIDPKIWEGTSSTKGKEKLPSIAEAHSSAKPKGVALSVPRAEGRKISAIVSPGQAPSMVGTGIDISHVQPDLDSISLKKSAVPPETLLKASPEHAHGNASSPARSPTNAPVENPQEHGSPSSSIRFPAYESNLTKDAGHTPLAPRAKSPEQGLKEDPLETPRPAAHDPVEISSTSTETGEGPGEQSDEDPELQQPLTLANDPVEDTLFFNEVNSKLSEGSSRPTAAPPSETSSSAADEEEESSDQRPEPDIPLRLKSSMNFGSAFGSATYRPTRE